MAEILGRIYEAALSAAFEDGLFNREAFEQAMTAIQADMETRFGTLFDWE
jgi:hypothetical protein